jgi:hypothetical protein
MSLVEQYQRQVLGPTQVVDYSAVVMQAYPPQAMQMEPFVGFKILCKDTNAFTTDPRTRLSQIDSGLGFLSGKGCIIRETDMSMPDGFWVITMPVPRSQVNQQLNNLMNVLTILEQYFGIIRSCMVEINVSGKCNIADTERCLSGLTIPSRYMTELEMPENTPYRIGHITRINDNFMVLRTRWRFHNPPTTDRYEDLVVLSQLISSIYH